MEKTRKIALTALLVFILLLSVIAVAPSNQARNPIKDGKKITAAKANYVFKNPTKIAARERVLEAKQLVNTARVDFKNGFKNLVDVRERYKNATVAEQKAVLRDDLRKATRLTLVGQVKVLKKKLGELEEDDTVFSEEEATLSNENATEQEVIVSAREIKKKWIEHKRKAKLKKARAVNQKLRVLNKKTDHFIEKLQALIAKLEEKGMDVSSLSEALDEFKGHKEKAEEMHALIKEEFENAQTPKEKDTAIRHAYRLLKAAHRQLMKDFIKMKKLINELRRGQAGDGEPEEEPEYEEVEAEELENVLVEVKTGTSAVEVEETITVDASTATEEEIVAVEAA